MTYPRKCQDTTNDSVYKHYDPRQTDGKTAHIAHNSCKSDELVGTTENCRNSRPHPLPVENNRGRWELADRRQFVGWKFAPDPASGKPKKPPINPRTGEQADTSKPETWGTYAKAERAVERYGLAGIGFVFTAQDPYAGVDLDDCRNPETGEIEPWAEQVIERFDSYAEVSPSGTGVKIICRGKLPEWAGHRKERSDGGRIEVYDRGQYFTITGEALEPGKPIRGARRKLEKLCRRLWPENEAATSPDSATPPEPVELEDGELLRRARRARNGHRFAALFDRGETEQYPSTSEADAALCGMLAFWTDRDAERMDRLFRHSALMRPKWEREDYRRRTIEQTIAGCVSGYRPGPEADPDIGETIRRLEIFAAQAPWTGRTGPTERRAYGVVLNTGGGYGRKRKGGFEVLISQRDLAPAIGRSQSNAAKSLERLEDRGLIKVLDRGNKSRPAKILLRTSPLTGHIEKYPPEPPPVFNMTCLGERLFKVRNPAPEMPEFDRNGRRIPRGKSPLLSPLGGLRSLIIEKVAWAPRGLDVSQIAERLERRPDKVKELLPAIAEAGLLIEDSGVYRAPPDLLERLDAELERSGCNSAEKRDRGRYARQREARRRFIEGRDREPDGNAAELERLDPEPEPSESAAGDMPDPREFQKFAAWACSELQALSREYERTPEARHAASMQAKRRSAARHKQAEARHLELQRERGYTTGITPEDFIEEEIGVGQGMRHWEMLGRWKDLGGDPAALADAIRSGPYRFKKEDVDFNHLYVYRAPKPARSKAAA